MARKSSALKTFHTDLSPRAIVAFEGQTFECQHGDISTEDTKFQNFLSENTNFVEVAPSPDAGSIAPEGSE